MNIKKKNLIINIIIIFIIQILLLINNNQKSSFRYFIWKIEDISVGKLICISFISGLIMSSLLGQKNIIHEDFNFTKGEDQKGNDNDNLLNNEFNNDSVEIPPERDVRDPQPTISVNYRVIKNNGENEINNINQTTNDYKYEDDWNTKDLDW